MRTETVSCLILACGNTLRGDDGIGPRLAQWAEERWRGDARIRVLSRQQWTPDLAPDIAAADSILFLDCSIESEPGAVQLRALTPHRSESGLSSHHTGAAELLTLAQEFYGRTPRTSMLLTIGAGATGLGESLTPAVSAAFPQACCLMEQTITSFLA